MGQKMLTLSGTPDFTDFMISPFMGPWMGGGGRGSRIRYSINKFVLIRDSISEISP